MDKNRGTVSTNPRILSPLPRMVLPSLQGPVSFSFLLPAAVEDRSRELFLCFCLWHCRCPWHYWLSPIDILYPNLGGRQNILVMASLCNGKPQKWWRHALYLRYVLAKWSVLSHWFLISVRVCGTKGALLLSAWLMILCILASPSGFSKMISWIK